MGASRSAVELPESERFLVDLLARTSIPHAGSDLGQSTVAWWQAERDQQEDLVRFLVRQAVFSSNSPSTLKTMRKGYVTFTDASPLLAPGGAQRWAEGAAVYVIHSGREPGANPPGERRAGEGKQSRASSTSEPTVRDSTSQRRPGARPKRSSPGSGDQSLPAAAAPSQPRPRPRAPAPAGAGLPAEWAAAEIAPAVAGPGPARAEERQDPPITRGSPRRSQERTAKNRFSSEDRRLARLQAERVQPTSSDVDTTSWSAAAAAAGSGTELYEIPEVGDRVGRCLLTDCIGRGGSCVVYRALHTAFKTQVAVKVMLPGEQGVETDGVEARVLARLNHPSILRILDFEPGGAYPYLVLEYVDGPTVHELIRQSGAIRPSRAVELTLMLSEALAHALEAGVLHRDLKPANVLLTRDGKPRLADLGVAALVSERYEAGIPALAAGGKGTGYLLGTPAYMAPERITGEGEDHRSDLYALGVTLFEMLTGETPFRAKTVDRLLELHVTEPPPAPHALVPELDPVLSQIVLRMLAKDPADRHASYEELARELSTWLRTRRPGSSRISREPGRDRHTSIWTSLASLFSGSEEGTP